MDLEKAKEKIDEYFATHSKEEIEEAWKKYEHLDNVGVKVVDFIEFQKRMLLCPPKFGSCPFTNYCFMNDEPVMCSVCGNLIKGNNITC